MATFFHLFFLPSSNCLSTAFKNLRFKLKQIFLMDLWHRLGISIFEIKAWKGHSDDKELFGISRQ